jgi:periplasmic divalent cation tolerance protein
MESAVIILCTMPDLECAENISQKLVEQRMAACCNIISNIKSVYSWKNEIQYDEEQLLVIKTLSSKYASVQNLILAEHPYEVPEIISVNISDGSKSYLTWITETLREA